ncbi:MAG: hypothetical protein ACFE9N_02015 [Promethearchaeota archaeon]
MSYIEKKYRQKIKETFDDQKELENALLIELNQKSVKNVNEIANLCAKFNHNINLILKKYYPEIKEMKDKLEIKSILKFYYDLIDKLTDLVRNIENYRKIDPEYYNHLIEFIEDKESLITGKYRTICAQELTAFYDPTSRENLEKILLEKLEMKSQQYFTFGALEEEIKKIAKIVGANYVSISTINEFYKEEFKFAESIINYTVLEDNNQDLLDKIGEELRRYLESKKYQAIVKPGMVITNAILISDKS